MQDNELSREETASMQLMLACASAIKDQAQNFGNVQQAIKAGADINYQHNANRTGKCVSATQTDPKIISSPLHAAVFTHKADIVTLLCEEKAGGKQLLKINEPNRHGTYALHLAVDRGNAAIVHTLLKHGADTNLICSMGRQGSAKKIHAIEVAIKSKKWESAQPIIEDIIAHGGSIADAAKQAGKMLSTLAREKDAPAEFVAFIEQLEKEAGITAGKLLREKRPSAEVAAPKISKAADPSVLASVLGIDLEGAANLARQLDASRKRRSR